MYHLSDYSYELPKELIAREPASQRENARLLHLVRKNDTLSHRRFHEICEILLPGDLLVVNNTRVIPGRLAGKKETGGKCEVLILDYGESLPPSNGNGREFTCLVRASKKTTKGMRLFFDEGLRAEVVDADTQFHRIRFHGDADFRDILDRIGKVPLPPYIQEWKSQEDPVREKEHKKWYQTVYAKNEGAIAAPTAGLHFTPGLLESLRLNQVEIAEITLHVGYGTFIPVRAGDIREHRMHSEFFRVSSTAADAVNRAKQEGRRVVAVGTTCVRTLEYLADENGRIRPEEGKCDLFIYPGFSFQAVDAMITNFHLPESTLIMLVSAFAGRKPILRAYREAVQEKYRFYSYGDAMFIE